MSPHQQMLSLIASRMALLPSDRVQLVGIDGVDGAGKTMFADMIAPLIEALGRPVIRASVDGFHRPRGERYKLGRGSPVGFYQDSYDYPLLRSVLLDPVKRGGPVRKKMFNVESNEQTIDPEETPKDGSILIFDGIFLHRPELEGYWDFSVFLDVAFENSVPRGAQRGSGSPDVSAPSNVRYVEGQKIDLSTCKPQSKASIVINYNDLAAPYISKDSVGEAMR